MNNPSKAAPLGLDRDMQARHGKRECYNRVTGLVIRGNLALVTHRSSPPVAPKTGLGLTAFKRGKMQLAAGSDRIGS
jgi:hypothetical protein